MTHWDRREAGILADALAGHCKTSPQAPAENALLVDIRNKAVKASQTVTTTFADLNHLRARVCSVCRGVKLYSCDVPHGWSGNCGLLASQTKPGGPV